MKVELDEREWNQLVTLVSQGPWVVANPLLTKISQQLTVQGFGQGLQGRPNGPVEGDPAHPPSFRPGRAP